MQHSIFFATLPPHHHHHNQQSTCGQGEQEPRRLARENRHGTPPEGRARRAAFALVRLLIDVGGERGAMCVLRARHDPVISPNATLLRQFIIPSRLPHASRELGRSGQRGSVGASEREAVRRCAKKSGPSWRQASEQDDRPNAVVEGSEVVVGCSQRCISNPVAQSSRQAGIAHRSDWRGRPHGPCTLYIRPCSSATGGRPRWEESRRKKRKLCALTRLEVMPDRRPMRAPSMPSPSAARPHYAP